MIMRSVAGFAMAPMSRKCRRQSSGLPDQNKAGPVWDIGAIPFATVMPGATVTNLDFVVFRSLVDRDHPVDLVGLETDRRGAADARQGGDVVKLAHDPLDPYPAGHVA